jgi:nicotinamide-nucleotide amidase
MATGVADLLSSDVAVAVTGVGGPDPQDGQPPGTVWWAVRSPEGVEAGFDRLDGSPRDVVAATVDLALRRLLAVLPPPADG